MQGVINFQLEHERDKILTRILGFGELEAKSYPKKRVMRRRRKEGT